MIQHLSKNSENRVELYANYATILRVKGKKQQAIQKCQQAIDVIKRNPKHSFVAYKAHVYWEMGSCKYQMRKEVPQYLEQAEADVKEALRIHQTEMAENFVK